MVRSKLTRSFIGRLVISFLVTLVPFYMVGQSVDKKAVRERQQRRSMLREKANEAFQASDWTRARAYYDSTLALGFLADVALQRAEACLLLKDTINYCSDVSDGAVYTSAARSERYKSICLIRDSVAFEASGFSAWEYSGVANVARVRTVKDGRTIHFLYGSDDSLLVALSTSLADTIFLYTDSMAQFPGGVEQMFMYLNKSVVYPRDALEKGTMGKADIEFIVNTDGTLTDFRLTESSGNRSLDAEALRVIKTMPTWSPGYFRRRPVVMRMRVPISFILHY